MNIAQNWRLNAQRYQFQGVKCEQCNTVHITPREICTHCQAQLPVQFSFEPAHNPTVLPTVLDFEYPVVHELRQAAR